MIPDCAKDLKPPRAVADNPYLCLTPAPPGGPPQEGAAEEGPPAAASGGGAPLGLLEFSLLRQMLRFSFETTEAKDQCVLEVAKLLLSLLGRHKSKGPLGGPRKDPPRGKPQPLLLLLQLASDIKNWCLVSRNQG